MARHVRNTEIDSAEDLLLGELDEGSPEEEAPQETSADDVSLGTETFSEEESAEGFEPEPARVSGPSGLLYYAVPAVGAMLILSLGWTFAFIVRTAFSPLTEEQKPIGEARVIPPPQPKTAEPMRPTLRVLVPDAPETPAEKPATGERGTIEEVPEGIQVSFNEPFFIPLEGGRTRRQKAKQTTFLHLSLSIAVSNEAAQREVNGKRAQIRAVVYNHYHHLSPADLRTLEGRERSRSQLMARLSQEVHLGKVQAVYFDEFYTR